MMVCGVLFDITCSGDRVYSATCQLCSGHYSTDDFTDYLSVSQSVYQDRFCYNHSMLISLAIALQRALANHIHRIY